MPRHFQAQAKQRLLAGDFGTEIAPGFWMQDLGRQDAEGDEAPVIIEGHEPLHPMGRSGRRRVAGTMAAKMMDHYMLPHVLNNPLELNPIRDGIPQCRKHPFVKGSATAIGCIHGHGNKERDQGQLPVARDYTVADVWAWVKALVELAVEDGDRRAGYTAKPDLTPGR